MAARIGMFLHKRCRKTFIYGALIMKRKIFILILIIVSIGSFAFMAINIGKTDLTINENGNKGVYDVKKGLYNGLMDGRTLSGAIKNAENRRTAKIAASGVAGGVFLLIGALAAAKPAIDKIKIKLSERNNGYTYFDDIDKNTEYPKRILKIIRNARRTRNKSFFLGGGLLLLAFGAIAAGYNSGMGMYYTITDKTRFDSPWGLIGGLSIFAGSVVFVIALALYCAYNKHMVKCQACGEPVRIDPTAACCRCLGCGAETEIGAGDKITAVVSKPVKTWCAVWLCVAVIAGISVLGTNTGNYFWSLAGSSYMSAPFYYVIYAAIGALAMLAVLFALIPIMSGKKYGRRTMLLLIITIYGIPIFFITLLIMRKKWRLYE